MNMKPFSSSFFHSSFPAKIWKPCEFRSIKYIGRNKIRKMLIIIEVGLNCWIKVGHYTIISTFGIWMESLRISIMNACMETQGDEKIVSCHWDFLSKIVFSNMDGSWFHGPTANMVWRGRFSLRK